MSTKLLSAAALGGLLFVASNNASAAIVTNGSFESGLSGWNTNGSGTTPGIGITVVTTGGTNTTGFGDNVPNYDGTHAAFFVDDNANENLFQNVTLSAGVLYNLSFALYATASGAANPFNFMLESSTGSMVLNTFLNSSSFTSVPVGVWTPESATFSVASSGSYLLDFNFTSGMTPSKDVLLDAVAINAVPEPASMLLLGSGLLGLTMLRRKRAS